MHVAIIDHGSGNLRSAAKAIERAGRDRGLTREVLVTADPERVRLADRVVLPGVGAFRDCRRGLAALDGMEQALAEAVLERGRPLLGICVGMQLLATVGHEHRDEAGLDWIPGEVSAVVPDDADLKVPHMGWNDLEIHEPAHPLLAAMGAAVGDAKSATGSAVPRGPVHAYFVHSYQFAPTDPDAICATVDYGGPVTAAVGRDNIFGTQFHPEKSQAAGLALLGAFLDWSP